MPTIPGPVDDNGNIIVPAGGGAVIPIKEQSNATPPVQIDISAVPLVFRVSGRLEITIPVDPNDALGKLLTITESDAEKLSTKAHSFQVLDVTNPLVPVPVWTGKIWRLT
jgi:hypothetical protein